MRAFFQCSADDTSLVYFVYYHAAACFCSMNDGVVVEQYAYVHNLSFCVIKKSKVAAYGVLHVPGY